ncbi:MAG: translocation/assembly module TamB domain-containing protein [Candidatus Babeliales bacterium]|nr:translocation/assembly module TamB domain-containing protein [Candidatus Babeliales bacterium]
MIKKIILTIFVLLAGAVIIFQNDHRVHSAVQLRVKKIFEDVGNCSAEFNVASVSLFVPSVTLENVHVTPKSGLHLGAKTAWNYQADRMTLSCSWWSLLFYGIIDLRVYLDRVDARSTVDNSEIAILQEHIMPMIDAPVSDVALYLKSITFGRSHIALDIPSAPLSLAFDWSSESKKMNDMFKTNIHMHDGLIVLDGQTILAKIAGWASFDLRAMAQAVSLELHTDCTAELEQLPEGQKNCFISGSWHDNNGIFSLKSSDQKVVFPAIALQYDAQGVHFKTQGTLPTESILNHLNPSLKSFGLEGLSDVNVTGFISSGDFQVHGTCIAKNLVYKNITLGDSASITFAKKQQVIQGSAVIEHSLLGQVGGSWHYDLGTQTGDCQITNYRSVAIPGIPLWSIAEHGAVVDITLDESRTVKGVYKAAAGSFILGGSVESRGAFSFDGNQFWATGKVSDATYQVAFDVNPELRLRTLVYKDSQGNKLIDIHADDPKLSTFQGPIQFELLRLIIKELLGYTMQGQGSFSLKGSLTDTIVNLKATLLDGGVIRLPQTYNLMNEFNADVAIDLVKKKIDINEIGCALHRGKLSSRGGTISFDDSCAIIQASVPITFDECLLNLKKDLFAMFSGSLTFTKERQTLPLLMGNVSIDQSQLKENLFSDKFQKELFAFAGTMFQTKSDYDMSCDVAITTKEPIRIDTAFFHGQAHALMHVGGTVSDPKLSGSIDLLAGSLEFPYKPLAISKGRIYFLPDQMYDPSIELIAINKIKKYDVMLHVTGSLLNHDIALESSPPLTDEQIVALLLVGSQEQSLNAVMPALIMQNLKTVLFDSEQSPLQLSSVFNSWLDPLRRINLVPRFSDQSGRGGLRGALEIDISDRWRAVAEQNFSLTEDTSFELEYAVSDDIILRGIRNERCDVGTEVEMRWKFGL